ECDMLASTATGVIDRLEQHGYVRRERDGDDRRVVWVELTDAGRRVQSEIPAMGEHMGRAFTALSLRELEQMLEWVRRGGGSWPASSSLRWGRSGQGSRSRLRSWSPSAASRARARRS